MSDEQSLDWQQECFSNNQDCLIVSGQGGERRLSCYVHPSHQLSDVAYQELKDAFQRWNVDSGAMGSWQTSAQFEFTLPAAPPIEEIVDDIRELLRRDRTPRRRVERQRHEAPREGMALALDLSELWEGHLPQERVYVLEMDGRPGRCVVFKHLLPPLVDLPLSSFRILAEVDV